MKKEVFVRRVKEWYKEFFKENEEEARIDVENHMRYIVGAIKHIEGGADEEKEFGTLTYMLGMA